MGILFSRCIAFAAIIPLAMTSAAKAVVIIDDFQTPAAFVSYSPFATSPQIFSHAGGTILGGDRQATFATTSGGFLGGDFGAVGQDIPYNPGSGVIFVDGLQFASGSASTVTLTYDGIGVGGLNDFDLLSAGNAIKLDFVYLNSGLNSGTQINITVDTNGNTLSYVGQIPDSNGNSFSYLAYLTDFTGGSILDFQQVDSIEIVLNSTAELATDFILTGISVQAVPEPSTMITWGMMLTAFLAIWHFGQKRS